MCDDASTTKTRLDGVTDKLDNWNSVTETQCNCQWWLYGEKADKAWRSNLNVSRENQYLQFRKASFSC